MAADVMKHFNLVLLVTQDDQRQPHEVDRFDVAFPRQVAREPQSRPAFAKNVVTFMREKSLAGIRLVG